jgi:hypothetical protein
LVVKMRGAVLVALAATVGNLLQGWDNSTIAGIYMPVYHYLISYNIEIKYLFCSLHYLLSKLHSGRLHSML